MNAKKLMTVALLSSALTACGGGGGGSTVGSTSLTGGAGINARAGFDAYVDQKGETDLAALTTENHASFVYMLLFSVIESDTKAAGYVWRSEDVVQPEIGMDGSIITPKELKSDAVGDEVVALLEEITADKDTLARYDNQGTRLCPYGGNVVITGDVDDSTSVGTYTAQYTDCYLNSGTIRKQGTAELIVTKRDPTKGIYLDYTLSYKGLTVMFPASGNYFVYTGTQQVTRTLINGDYVKSVVDTSLKRDDQAGDIYLDDTKNTMSLKGQSISGKICIGRFGCVDISTKEEFNTHRAQGDITLTGANNSKIHLYYDDRTGDLHTRIDGSGTGAYGPPLSVF